MCQPSCVKQEGYFIPIYIYNFGGKLQLLANYKAGGVIMLDIERKYLLLGLVFALLLVFMGGVKYADFRDNTSADEDLDLLSLQTLNDKQSGQQPPAVEETEFIQVYLTGEVKNPGVYKLDSEARLYEALDMAGPMDTADLKRINLARKMSDGEAIIVPAIGEEGVSVDNTGNLAQEEMFLPLDGGGGKVNINRASEQELQDKLPGVGPVLAGRIVQYRSSNGNFASIQDICNVSGIGEKRFADIKDLISVR